MGEIDPFRLADNMPASLFNAWQKYYSIEPFGVWRDNFHAATISAILANQRRPKDRQPFAINDYMFKCTDQAEADKRAESVHKAEIFRQTLRAKKAAAASGRG